MLMMQIGRLGEQLAATYLTKNGYIVVDRNVHARVGEIDIVANKDGVTHFCEVKTRTGGQAPQEALTPQKRRRLRASAIRLSHQRPDTKHICCDLISVEVGRDARSVRINHVHDQF